ncbi:hypothetical protein EWM64_g7682 [Hericium alpestre]|uniref:N-acetyltransferase domain-containing protein n=1 Tax=Hericium alpestre TaxID=135208 RepID=A0A4Y9ZR81_9AGAM|nr:hypothetical protein EWM64_g7682 [Hericium alpestre]
MRWKLCLLVHRRLRRELEHIELASQHRGSGRRAAGRRGSGRRCQWLVIEVTAFLITVFPLQRTPLADDIMASKRIDISTLQLKMDERDDEGLDSSESEWPYWQEYRFAVRDIVTIHVETIDKAKIEPGAFHTSLDEVSEDLLQFSKAVFDCSGRIKAKVACSGTQVWGAELNKTDAKFAYIKDIIVSPQYRRQGVGRWAIDALLQHQALEDCPWIFTWATSLNLPGKPAGGANARQNAAIAFFRKQGFRRVGGTWFFGYARDGGHPSRALPIEGDAEATQTAGARGFTERKYEELARAVGVKW